MEQISPGLGSSHILLNLGVSNEKLVLHTQISPLLSHQYLLPLLACMKGDTGGVFLPTYNAKYRVSIAQNIYKSFTRYAAYHLTHFLYC